MPELRNRFKALLREREAIEDRRIPYREVARKAGVHEATVSRWAHQVGRFDADTIVALCVYFDCGPGDLFELVEEVRISAGLPIMAQPAMN